MILMTIDILSITIVAIVSILLLHFIYGQNKNPILLAVHHGKVYPKGESGRVAMSMKILVLSSCNSMISG